MKSLFSPLAPNSYLADFGLPSNFQIILPVSGSSPYTQPSPAGKITWGLPPITPYAGFDHCPCMMFRPGRLLFQISFPVFLFRQTKLGASGNGMLMWFSSTPLAVVTYSRSPTMSGEQSDMLCGNTLNWSIRLTDQRTSPSMGLWYFSFWNPWLPSANPLASRQTTSHRLEV